MQVARLPHISKKDICVGRTGLRRRVRCLMSRVDFQHQRCTRQTHYAYTCYIYAACLELIFSIRAVSLVCDLLRKALTLVANLRKETLQLVSSQYLSLSLSLSLSLRKETRQFSLLSCHFFWLELYHRDVTNSICL